MKRYIKENRRRVIIGLIVSIGMMICTVIAFAYNRKLSDLRNCLGLSILAGLWTIVPKKLNRYVSIPAALIIPFLAMVLLQTYSFDVLRMYPSMAAVNCVFFYLFYVMLSALSGRLSFGYTTASLLAMLVGIADAYVIEFRSSPIVPWDLLSLGTAASVADNYTYSISWRMLYVSFGFVFLILTSRKLCLRRKSLPVRILLFLISGGLLFGAVSAIQKKSVKDWLGMDQTLFTPLVRYRNNGFTAAFLGNLYLINIDEPDGYSVKKVEELQKQIEEEAAKADTEAAKPDAEDVKTDTETAKAGTEAAGEDDMPNIIVIMNEAFSDLSVLGDFETSEDYMPFLRSVMEDYTSGQLMVSVKGGNTANTEYEFLSGDSMAFLPAGSVVYQQYIKSDLPTLATHLKSLGYTTTAIHPYKASGWDRDRVYPKIGFEEFLDMNYFQDPKLLRSYISDESAFDKIIEVFEEGSPDEKQFIFEVTMQNHSAYSKVDPETDTQIKLPDFKTVTPSVRAAQNYLTLVRASDDAFKKLIAYFEKVDEPTVIVMFGDHQPSDYVSDVIARLTGYDSEASLEEYQKSFLVPFVIWDNFGLEKDDTMKMTSANYLSAYLLQRLGLPLTDYQRFLLTLREALPVICAGTYIDSDGTYHSYSEQDSPYESVLNSYNILQYNHLTDGRHRVESLFGN